MTAQPSNKIEVYLENGEKRTFAGAIDWPGWCRSGSDEDSALQALFEAGPRYARIFGPDPLGFRAPAQISWFTIVERLKGNPTTDFGAPGIAPASDARPVNEADLQRFQKILDMCWNAFDEAVRLAGGKELRKGPRGGGRELEGIIRHVMDSNGGYLSAVGWKLKKNNAASLSEQLKQTRQAVREALAAAAHGEIAEIGPRGGARWTPRYFVRRVAWHIIDHAWEIEDRIL